jgi:tetratricopeptide (TPR) repeat protein
MSTMNRLTEISEETSNGSALLAVPETRALSSEARKSFEQGLLLLQCGEPAQAAEALSQSVALAPDFAEGHMCLGLAQAMNHSIYPASDHLERATELAPDSFAVHYMLAHFNFKLRIPQKGYAAAQRALQCATRPQERYMLSQLISKEKEREHNGIARPWFNKPFSSLSLALMGGGLVASVFAIVAHIMLNHIR